MNNVDRWNSVYRAELAKAMESHPDEYMPGIDAEIVANRMIAAFERGTYNKDSRAIRATCRHFGIKHTYAAINAFRAAVS